MLNAFALVAPNVNMIVFNCFVNIFVTTASAGKNAIAAIEVVTLCYVCSFIIIYFFLCFMFYRSFIFRCCIHWTALLILSQLILWECVENIYTPSEKIIQTELVSFRYNSIFNKFYFFSTAKCSDILQQIIFSFLTIKKS